LIPAERRDYAVLLVDADRGMHSMISRRQFEERCWAGTVAVVAAGLWLGQAVQAQEPGSVTIDVSNCVDLEKPEERLACFEREVEAQRRPAPAPAPAANRAPAAPAVAAPPPPREAPPREVVRTPVPAPAAEPRRRGRGVEPLGQEILAKVTEVRETVPNTWTITLDNGQVWRQTTPKSFVLRPGMEVRLYPTKWGDSYRLTSGGPNGFIQVERVR
jgi:hypothetical protein